MPAFKIDTVTVAAISALVEMMLVLILLHAWRTRTTYSGFLTWVLGTACWLLGLSLMMVGDKVAALLLIMLNPVLLYEGFRRFHDQPTRWYGLPLNLAAVAATLGSEIYFLQSNHPAGGSFILSATLPLLFARVAVEPLLDARGRRYSIQWLLSAVLIPLIVLTAMRGYWHPRLSGENSLCGLAFFYGIVVEIIISYCYLSLTSQRVEEELSESGRKYRELSSSLQLKVEEEIRLRLAQERLLADQARLAAMGKMIGAIAHQWRQPLTTLSIMVQRVHAQAAMKGVTEHDLKEFKGAALRQIGHMSDTIEQFRSFYRPEKSKEPFSPLACISDSLTLFDPHFAGSGIKVEVESQRAEGLMVDGFANQFKQVVLNLLSNSRDAILERRKAAGMTAEGRIDVLISKSEPATMSIEISDNGCGIAAEAAAMVFDPYFTTKEESGGTGVGLYVSRMIVEDSLGGRLLLARSDEGAAFRIELPIKERR